LGKEILPLIFLYYRKIYSKNGEVSSFGVQMWAFQWGKTLGTSLAVFSKRMALVKITEWPKPEKKYRVNLGKIQNIRNSKKYRVNLGKIQKTKISGLC